MVLKLKMIGVDRDLHDRLKSGAARLSKTLGKHISIREFITIVYSKLEDIANESERQRIEIAQLKAKPLDETYEEKLRIETVAIEARVKRDIAELYESWETELKDRQKAITDFNNDLFDADGDTQTVAKALQKYRERIAVIDERLISELKD